MDRFPIITDLSEARMLHVRISFYTGHQWGWMERGQVLEGTLQEDTDYSDELFLPTSRVDYMQEKTARLEKNAGRVGLKLNSQKCKWMKVNSRSSKRLRVRDSLVKEVDSFFYLWGRR